MQCRHVHANNKRQTEVATGKKEPPDCCRFAALPCECPLARLATYVTCPVIPSLLFLLLFPSDMSFYFTFDSM